MSADGNEVSYRILAASYILENVYHVYNIQTSQSKYCFIVSAIPLLVAAAIDREVDGSEALIVK